MTMFGVLISGRLVQTDFQQVNETHFIFNIPDADNVNHIVVFMTGQTPFPDIMGGAVYFSWPSPNGPNWQLLGNISNAKPSAIFKVSKLKSNEGFSAHPFGQYGQQMSHMAAIGISVEPLAQLVQQTCVPDAVPSTMDSFMEFATKMLENFVNFASSFAITQAQMTPNPNETYVPLSSVQQWFSNFQRRLQQNPTFWKS